MLKNEGKKRGEETRREKLRMERRGNWKKRKKKGQVKGDGEKRKGGGFC